MRFMIIVKATRESEAGVMPEEALIGQMATFHEELAKAGALLDASGLQPSRKGWRVRYSGGKRSVTDGPFAETKELIAGYTIIQVKSGEEALPQSGRRGQGRGDRGAPVVRAGRLRPERRRRPLPRAGRGAEEIGENPPPGHPRAGQRAGCSKRL
jgi:hypothetical protein